VDIVEAYDGNVPSGNILTSLTWNLSGGAYFDGSELVLPFGSSAASDPYAFYTVDINDFYLPGHVLPDTATIIWIDECDSNSQNCPIGDQFSTTGSQATVTAPLPCVMVDKSVVCDITEPGEVVTYMITIENCGGSELTREVIYDSLLGDLNSLADSAGCDILGPNEFCYFDVNYVVASDNPNDILNNTVDVIYSDAFAQEANDYDTAEVTLIHPDFTVTKSCQNDPVPPGGSAIFDVVITNIGDVNLDFMTNEPCLPTSFSLAPDTNLAVTLNLPFDGNDVFNQIIVEANLPDDLCYQLPENIVKEANDTCTAEQEGATRTLGFWKTHIDYTEHIFNAHCGGDVNLGWVVVDSNEDVFGILWSNPAKNSDGSKRTELCKARIKASIQALAALLNNCLDNGAPLPMGLTPGEIADILGGTDVDAIKDLGELLDDYNNSGDEVAIIDFDGYLIQHADPKAAKETADYTAGDCESVMTIMRRGGRR
jgi:hypothetical protein